MSTVAKMDKVLDLGPTRKVRSDAKLERLTAGQHARLRVWLEDENRTYAHIVGLVRAEFGFSVGKSAVGVYYQRHIVAEQYDHEVEAAAVLAKLPIERFSPAILYRAKVLGWSLLVRPDPQIDAATRLLKVVRRVEWQEIRRQRLELKARRLALRARQLAARPPRHPRITTANRGALVTRELRSPASVAPAPLRKISGNPPRFPAYSEIVLPATLPAPTSLNSPQGPAASSLNAQSASLNPARPAESAITTTTITTTTHAPRKTSQNSPRFPAYSPLIQPPAPARIAEPHPCLTSLYEYEYA